MITKLKKALQAFKLKNIQPKTYIASGSSKRQYFSERQRNKDLLKKYQTIYEQGGIISEAIDTYALFSLANGWRLEGEDEKLIQKVQDWLDLIDFDSVIWQGITDSLVFGDAFQENVNSRGGDFISVVPRLASSFDIIHDEYGIIQGYEQRLLIDGLEKTTYLKQEQITHLQLFQLGGYVYGHSLIQRAYDEILRDTKTAESSAVAIERHGFKKYHIKLGQTGEIIPEDVIKKVSKEFQELESKNDFVTPYDVEIKNIDEGGLEKIDTYHDISIMRLCAALGVPEELLGLRRGSTDATAQKRIDAFYKKIKTIQNKVARCYTLNVIDRIVGRHGIVWLVFNDVSPDDEAIKAAWISNMMKSTPIDPFAVLPRRWIQEQFDISEQDYDADEIDDYTVKSEPEPEPEPEDNETEQGNKEGTDTDKNTTK